VPDRTIVVATPTASAVASRNELREMFVPASTSLSHRPWIQTVIHVLHGINAQEAIVVGTVVAVKLIIRIL